MATPRPDNFTVPSGTTTIRLGRPAPAAPVGYTFDTVDYAPGTGTVRTAAEAAGQILVFEYHANGGFDPTQAAGGQYTAKNLPASMSPGGIDSCFFHITRKNTDATYRFYLCPLDRYGTLTSNVPRQSRHFGFANAPDPVTGDPVPEFQAFTHRRYDAMLDWAEKNCNHDKTRVIAAGTSMGSYGVTSHAMRRYDKFAALYIDLTQFLYGYDNPWAGKVQYSDWVEGWPGVAANALPNMSAADGGGNLIDWLDHISYIANPANKIRWMGVSGHKNDVNNDWQNYVDAITAMREAKRPFAFFWGSDNHSSRISTVAGWVPFDSHKTDRGLPYFSNCSTDADFSAATGTINGGLQWEILTETPTLLSMRIRNIIASCTVDVEPHSEIFTATVAKQNKTLTQGVWVDVTFTA